MRNIQANTASQMPPWLEEHGFWEIPGLPAALAGMVYPTTEIVRLIPYPRYQGILCLADEEPCYEAPPLRLLDCVELPDLSDGSNPRDPTGYGMICIRLIRLVISELLAGRGVALHCWGGCGRSGLIAAGTLIAFGTDPLESARIVNEATTKAETGSWPESGWHSRFLTHLPKVDLGVTKEAK